MAVLQSILAGHIFGLARDLERLRFWGGLPFLYDDWSLDLRK
jgi:hypothetical protein